MSWRVGRWWLVGILAYLVFLLATLPASYATGWVQKRVPDLQLAGVRGSVWAGSAQDAAWQGESWGQLHWRFDWTALFAGHLGCHVFLDAPELVLQAKLAGNSSRVQLEDVTGHLPVSRLLHWLPLSSDSVAGRLNIRMQRIVLVNARPTVASGSITLTDVRLSWPQSANLGDYQLQLQTQADGIHGSLLDTSGPLMLQGSLHMTQDGRYAVTGVVALRDPSDAALSTLLRYLPGNQDGKHAFNFSGQW